MGIEIKDAATLIGIVVSLGVGVRNWIVTASIRSGTILLEEFRSQIRDPIQKKMDKLSEVRDALIALQRPNALTDDELREKISAQVAIFEFIVQDLLILCEHADESSFAKGKNWNERYAARLEKTVERLGSLTSKTPLDRLSAGKILTETCSEINAVGKEIRKRFEHDVKTLIPSGFFGGRRISKKTISADAR